MTVADQATRFVTFRVGRELFAIDVSSVEQVLRYETARRMPRLPAWIDGILEHQGRVVPLVDLRRHFDVPIESGDQPQARLLLLNIAEEWCAVAVDQVLDVRPYDMNIDAESPLGMMHHAGELYTGMVKRGDALVAVIDATRLFSAAERAVLLRTTRTRKNHAAADR